MRKTYGPLKLKVCQLGANCGGTCIAKNKTCNIALKPREKVRLRAAVKKLNSAKDEFFNLFKLDRILADSDVKPLGIGAYGIVVLTGGNALKTSRNTVKKGKMQQEVGFQMQANALGLAPKVLAFNNSQILMEKATGSTVALLKSNGKLKQQDLTDYQKKITDAIISLHKKGIAHNDAHQENIFYDVASKKVTFIDFGLASKADYFALHNEYKRAVPYAYQ
jgi:serine/threonine protein kinase